MSTIISKLVGISKLIGLVSSRKSGNYRFVCWSIKRIGNTKLELVQNFKIVELEQKFVSRFFLIGYFFVPVQWVTNDLSVSIFYDIFKNLENKKTAPSERLPSYCVGLTKVMYSK